MTRRQRILHRLTWLLVATIGAIAFTASFEAIADYAGQVGWGPQMKYAAPLLVDTFTLAAGLVILARAEAGVRAVYAWSLLIVAAGVSIGLNIAHAPDRLAAQVVAALPPAALLAAVELAMSEARRARSKPAPVPTPGVGERGQEGATPTAPPGPAPGASDRAAAAPSPRPAGTSAGRGSPPTTSPRVQAREAPAPGGSTLDRSAERARVVREQLVADPDKSANKIKGALREAGVGVGESGAFYALVERLRSEVKAESNGHREEVGA